MTTRGRNVNDLLAQYVPEGEVETADAARIRDLLATEADPWTRAIPLHVTASALIVHPASRLVLLRWHQRQQAWLQVGGHADPGETDPLAIALREGCEETGLTDLTPWPTADLAHLTIVPVSAGETSPHTSTRTCGSCWRPRARTKSCRSTPTPHCVG